jgi:microcystin-dependent protein
LAFPVQEGSAGYAPGGDLINPAPAAEPSEGSTMIIYTCQRERISHEKDQDNAEANQSHGMHTTSFKESHIPHELHTITATSQISSAVPALNKRMGFAIVASEKIVLAHVVVQE